jgi:hypothetical protein
MATHTIKYEYENGVKLIYSKSWCGKNLNKFESHFLDAQHLALSVGGSRTPCKNCIKSIIKELNKELI